MKFILALAVGLAGGYYYGFADGSAGKPSIVTRVVEQIGGNSRGRVRNDVDAAMDRLEGGTPADPAKKPVKARTP
jgi:hypothetical protein